MLRQFSITFFGFLFSFGLVAFSQAEITNVSRPTTKSSQLSRRQTAGITKLDASSSLKSTTKNPQLSTTQTNVRAMGWVDMVNWGQSNVSMSVPQPNLTMAAGETKTVTVTIDRNGYQGNLYFAAIYGGTFTESLETKANFSISDTAHADGAYSGNSFTVNIVASPVAPVGSVGLFKIMGHETETNKQIAEIVITATIAGGIDNVTQDSAEITINSPIPGSPMLNGTYIVGDAKIGAFLDYNNDGLVSFATGSNDGVYPRMRAYDPSTINGWATFDGRAYEPGANLVVDIRFSTWSSVNRPQFLTIYLNANGQQVTPVSTWAGDMETIAQDSYGETEGMVLTSESDDPPTVVITTYIPPTEDFPGMIQGYVQYANVWVNTQSGNLIGNPVQVAFQSKVHFDGAN